MDIRKNHDNYELITDLFHTLKDIYETHIDFGQIVVVLEDQVEKKILVSGSIQMSKWPLRFQFEYRDQMENHS